MAKRMIPLSVCFAVLSVCSQAQQPCIPGTNCNGNCSTCELGPKDQLGNSCFICGTDANGVGYVCRVTGCDYCSERVPICYQQARFQLNDRKALFRRTGLRSRARCIAQAAPSPTAHQQMLEENKDWMSNPSVGAKLPETYARALVALKDSITANGVAGTKKNPAYYRGYMQNRDLHLSTKWFAINVAPGKWELTVEKAIYGESVIPNKIIVSNLGTKEVEK